MPFHTPNENVSILADGQEVKQVVIETQGQFHTIATHIPGTPGSYYLDPLFYDQWDKDLTVIEKSWSQIRNGDSPCQRLL